ncbi:MAG: FAD-binding protein [Gammaproteobacteria bacterium]|nr:FAD-binding protein [Gammaproteobacteria bacterium]
MDFEAVLAAILPRGALLTSEESKRPYECDGLSAYRALPRAVCLPRTRDEVRQIIAVCAEHRVPLVPRGAGTGLSGGALPLTDGVLLSLARFNRILEIDPENRIAVVEPGVRNLAISEAVAVHGLYYAPDPSSQIACSIGGNVAENSGGVHCLKYGLTVHNVLGVKMFLSTGEWIELGGRTGDAPGLDLLAVINGSEGLLGVIMEITVKLLPRPPVAKVLLAAFDTVAAAGEAVAGIIEAGVIPAGLEMMDRLAIQVAEEYCHAGYPRDAAAILLCELDGLEEEVAAEIVRVEALLCRLGAIEVRCSRDEAERSRFWLGRKSAFPAIGRIAPDYYCMDGTIPRRELSRVLTRIAELSRESGLLIANVFHAGDGNLHPLIAYDANDDQQLAMAEAVGGKILEICIEVGGTVTGEHGVGVEKLNQMCIQFGTPELELFHRLKAAFDPHTLLNPGRAVPTLHRCAEFGAMHVHSGQLPHSDLPRF